MTFQPGNQEAKGYGRIPGKPNRRSFELEQRLRDRGDVDPADFCSSIVSSDKESTELKLAAANYLLPYLYSKRGAMPPPRFIDGLEIDVNEFQHVSDAENFLAKIALLTAKGHLDIQSAQELSGLVKTWIDSQYQREELQFKINPPEQHDQIIQVQGGLPSLPGTRIDMPQLNGHTADARALAAPTDIIPSTNQVPETTANELSPGQLKAQGPYPLKESYFKPDPEPGKNSPNGGGEPCA
jgi:hypothetical protein